MKFVKFYGDQTGFATLKDMTLELGDVYVTGISQIFGSNYPQIGGRQLNP